MIPGGLVTFMGLKFETNESVLVPREETELLGRTALDLFTKIGGKDLRVIDMCCGAGNLACALACARPDIRLWASDLTDACVNLARRNVARHELQDRVEVCQGDLFGSLASAKLEAAVDVVVCNPPYISTGRLDGASAHLLDGQPREAFDAGPYGFAIHKRVITDAPRFLKPGGWLVMEIGLGQERQIESLFKRVPGYEERELMKDENRAPRVVAARRSNVEDDKKR
jgi:release factor glutamine methyltransferase